MYIVHVVFVSVVVNVWGSEVMFMVKRPLLKIAFLAWSLEVCCMFVYGVCWMLCFLFIL